MRCSLLGLNDESRWTGSSVTLSQRTSMFLTALTGRACTFAFTLPTGQYYQYLYTFPRFWIHLVYYETEKYIIFAKGVNNLKDLHKYVLLHSGKH